MFWAFKRILKQLTLWWRNSSWVGCVFWKPPNWEIWKFDFLHVCLKVDTVRYRCRMNVIESALERAGPRVCDHKIVWYQGWLELSFWTELSMGLIRKLRNRLFQNLEFCIHDATLGADLARCGCRMDMVDGALERVDVACFNPNIEIVSWCLFLLKNSFEFQDFSKFPGFWKKFS